MSEYIIDIETHIQIEKYDGLPNNLFLAVKKLGVNYRK